MFGARSRGGEPVSVNWKTNLAALWLAQFLTIGAYGFCIPFLPLYLVESGIVPPDEVPYWSGLLLAGPAFSMMIMSPIWGALGDRYGRKMMLVRATLAGAFVLYLMGTVDNIEGLAVLRLLQGAFTGTTPAAQTLVATNTPDKNQGFAIGLIMAAVSAGNLAGATLGGFSAKHFGVVFSFKLAGIVVFAATLLVILAVRENFTRPLPAPQNQTKSTRLRLRREYVTNFRAGLPVLAVIGAVSYIQTFDGPFISLYIDHLYRNTLPAAEAAAMSAAEVTGQVYGITGLISGAAGLAAVAGSIITGSLLDRDLPKAVWPLAAAVAGAGALCIGLSDSFFGLTAGRAAYLFCISGLASVLVVILGRLTPPSKRGAALGWSMTVRAMGWGLAPMSGAFTAAKYDWPAAFGAVAAMCLLLAPMFMYLTRRYRSAFSPVADDPPSIGTVGVSDVSTPGGQGRVG